MTCEKCCIHSGVTKYEEESCPFYKTESEADRQNAAFVRKQTMLEDCAKGILAAALTEFYSRSHNQVGEYARQRRNLSMPVESTHMRDHWAARERYEL